MEGCCTHEAIVASWWMQLQPHHCTIPGLITHLHQTTDNAVEDCRADVGEGFLQALGAVNQPGNGIGRPP
jgi:hypothetical protein